MCDDRVIRKLRWNLSLKQEGDDYVIDTTQQRHSKFTLSLNGPCEPLLMSPVVGSREQRRASSTVSTKGVERTQLHIQHTQLRIPAYCMCSQARQRPRSASLSHRGSSCTLPSCNSSSTQKISPTCGASAAISRDARPARSGAPPSRLLSSGGRQTRPPSRQRCFARTP